MKMLKITMIQVKVKIQVIAEIDHYFTTSTLHSRIKEIFIFFTESEKAKDRSKL